MPTPLTYEVSVVLRDEETARRWVRWMLDEHIADVVAAGARSGRLIQIDDIARSYAVQYEFDSRAAFEQYLRDHAPRLRDAGTRLFSAAEAVYSRRTGSILDA